MIPRVFVPDVKVPPVLPTGGNIVSLAGDTMGTTWSVRVVAEEARKAEISVTISHALETVIVQMSPWRPDSCINRFNKALAGSWIAIPPEFTRVLTCATEVAADSGGAFDPTLGALVELWGFGAGGPVERPPAADAVAAARQNAGWRRLDGQDGAAFQPGGLRLDFSGIAKGFAVDLVVERLAALGFDAALVEIGGELRASGIKPNGQPWWVDLEAAPGSPFAPSRFALLGQAIATSGDYRRFLIHDGGRLSHTLDPFTGYPVSHGLASVTVLADSAMRADAYATAITVLGPDAGHDYAERNNLAALLVERQQQGWRERMTPVLAAMLD